MRRLTLIISMAVFTGLKCLWADDDVATREEAAFKAAVEHIAPSVVRIETLGGLETVGNVLVGNGPTTGLIVSADGFIITSAFNFVQKPAQILVDLADGARLPAEIVAHDNSRMIVLLKVKIDPAQGHQLVVPEFAPVNQMRVGQWAIAVGRVFNADKPNLSVGVISAVNRVWGKAIQTDAKISPANYGGPLVDIQGRVLGVLVPMSPMETGEMAGFEWYDSGIGFAVPLEHINRVLDRLKRGEDLQPGLMGVNLKPGDPYAIAPVIAAVLPKSPAAQGGLKAGDKIVEIEGAKIASQVELKHQLAPHYAGEKISLVVLRDEKPVECSLELTAKLEPYVHSFLGILPRRDREESGVAVRYVYPDSPAAKAGIKPGDKINSIGGQVVKSSQALQDAVASHAPLESVKIEMEREGAKEMLEAKLATLPEKVPEELPPARDASPPSDDESAIVGKQTIKIPEAPSDCLVYVPESYNSHVPYGMVIWLHPAGGLKEKELLNEWKPICEALDLILVAPKSAEPARWQRTELEFIRKAADDVISKYNTDRTRIVAAGQEAGGAMAFLLAAANRELVRGVATVNTSVPPGLKMPTSEPVQRLAFFAVSFKEPPAGWSEAVKRLREAKHPVTDLKVGDNARALKSEEWQQLARWIDTLDRS